MKLLDLKIKELDGLIGASQSAEEKLLESLPGIGPVFSSLIATEIDGLGRFATAARFAAYCGLVPTTHASGGRVSHGRVLWQCNKWLRWALVEASWSAVQFSGYFGSLYRAAIARGKPRNVAIVGVAHRLSKIIWLLLQEKRPYTEARPMKQTLPAHPPTTFPDRSEPKVTVAARHQRVGLAS